MVVRLVTKSCLTLCNSVDYSPPGSFVHGFSRQEYWSGLPVPPSILRLGPLINITKHTFLAPITSVQFSSVSQSCLTLCNPMDCSTPGFPLPHQLLKLAQTRVHQVGDPIQPSHPLLSPSPPAFNLSQHQGLFHKSVLHIRWPKYWSFSFSISFSNEYSGLILSLRKFQDF